MEKKKVGFASGIGFILVAAGNTAVVVFAYALVALCVVAYFAFFRNRDTGTNADEKLSGDYPV